MHDHLLSLVKFLSANILSCVINDYIEDVATFTTLAKIYSIELANFCQVKISVRLLANTWANIL